MSHLFERRPFQVGVFIFASIFALPLIWHQAPGLSFVIYPLVILGVSWLIGAFASRYVRWQPQDETPIPMWLLFIIACGGLGLFAVWAATLPLEIVGNLWRGNVLLSNLVLAALSLCAGAWSAYSLSRIQQSNSRESSAIAITGVAVLTLVAWSGAIYDLPEFSMMNHFGKSYIRSEYIAYGILEAVYWRVIFPFGTAAALLINFFLAKPK